MLLDPLELRLWGAHDSIWTSWRRILLLVLWRACGPLMPGNGELALASRRLQPARGHVSLSVLESVDAEL